MLSLPSAQIFSYHAHIFCQVITEHSWCPLRCSIAQSENVEHFYSVQIGKKGGQGISQHHLFIAYISVALNWKPGLLLCRNFWKFTMTYFRICCSSYHNGILRIWANLKQENMWIQHFFSLMQTMLGMALEKLSSCKAHSLQRETFYTIYRKGNQVCYVRWKVQENWKIGNSSTISKAFESIIQLAPWGLM